MQSITILQLQFPDIPIYPSHVHKVRGFYGNQYKEYDLLHNHDIKTGKVIYRYPAIQFKTINNILTMLALGSEAYPIIEEIFLKNKFFLINDKKIPILSKNLKKYKSSFGFTEKRYQYTFLSPWLALNQKNYADYKNLQSISEKLDKLESILINNIISFSKFANYTVPDKIVPKIYNFKTRNFTLKGNIVLGILCDFEVNFLLPDFIGLGKSSSRGYGVILRNRS